MKIENSRQKEKKRKKSKRKKERKKKRKKKESLRHDLIVKNRDILSSSADGNPVYFVCEITRNNYRLWW